MTKILLIGATSAIAHETARFFAARGDTLFLVTRNRARLDRTDEIHASGPRDPRSTSPSSLPIPLNEVRG